MLCQVQDMHEFVPVCRAQESGGLYCERTDPHGEDGHWISPHTVRHDRIGNGYWCRDGEFVGFMTMAGWGA
jgi:hypothetical protein